MATITITLAGSIASCTVRRRNGMTTTWTSGTQSWSSLVASDYVQVVDVTPASGYTTPVYFYRTVPTSYTQNLAEDDIISFSYGGELSDKAGTIGASAVSTYRINYNANGGSGAPASQIKYYGQTLTLSSTKPTWSGHTFLGWSTSSDRNASVQYQAGGKYTANAGATLYAVWQVSAAFYSKGSLYSQSYTRIGGSVTLPTLSNTEAETFEGWLGDDGETYRAGSTVTLMQNHTFTAIWKAITYTVSYNTNGGTGGPVNGVKVHGTAYTIPSSKPKKTGYIFTYWVDNLESGRHWSPGDSYTTNSNVTFTAIWRQKTYFYWHGSDASDSTYFAVGKRIDLAVTAEAWNRLCDFVNEVRGYAGLSTVAFSTVSAGDEISAVKHTIVSNAIKQLVNAGYGTVVPATVSTGDEIVTSLYNGNGSLKDAINKAVDDL